MPISFLNNNYSNQILTNTIPRSNPAGPTNLYAGHAEIIQHYNCSNNDLEKKLVKRVPPFVKDVSLNTYLDNYDGLDYIQAIFDTNDDKDTITSVLSFMGAISKDLIRVNIHPILGNGRIITFSYDEGYFNINAYQFEIPFNGAHFGIKYK